MAKITRRFAQEWNHNRFFFFFFELNHNRFEWTQSEWMRMTSVPV